MLDSLVSSSSSVANSGVVMDGSFWTFMWSTISFPLFVFLFFTHLIYIWSVHFAPLIVSVFIGNPYTALAPQNWGAAALNFQTMNLFLYHTTATDRLLHVVGFCSDAFGFACLAYSLIHVLNPAVISIFPSFAPVLSALPISLGTVIVLMTFISLILQAHSFAGTRLATLTAIFWTILFGLAGFLYNSLFTLCSSFSSSPPSSSASLYIAAVLLSWAMKLHLCSGVLRTIGHMVDYQRWGIVGNIQIVGSYGLSRLLVKPLQTFQNAFPWSSNPFENIRYFLVIVSRLMLSYVAALTAELNAGLPCRLIPVCLHLLALRINLYEEESYVNDEENWTEKRIAEESGKLPLAGKMDERTVENFLLRLEELNEWTSALVQNGLQYSVNHFDLNNVPCTINTDCVIHSHCKRWRWIDADRKNPLHFLRQQEFAPRELSGRRLSQADPRSKRSQSVHLVLPLEQKGYHVWGLWPEMPAGIERKAEDPVPKLRSSGSGNNVSNTSNNTTSSPSSSNTQTVTETLDSTPAASQTANPVPNSAATSSEKQNPPLSSSSSLMISPASTTWLSRGWWLFFVTELPVCFATCVLLLFLNYQEYQRLLLAPSTLLQPHLDSLLSFSVAVNVLFCSYCYFYGRLLYFRSSPNAIPQPPCRRSFYLLQEAMFIGDVIVVVWNIIQYAVCPVGAATAAACGALSAQAWTACIPATMYGGARFYWMMVHGRDQQNTAMSVMTKTLKSD